jgi:hypothetical protein
MNTKILLFGLLMLMSIGFVSAYSWTQQNGSGVRNWQDVASSSDGSKLVSIVDGGFIYTSANSGVSWTEQSGAGSRSWWGVASSADGSRLVATARDSHIYVSNDSGVSWADNNIASDTPNFLGVASSADGSKLYATNYDGGDCDCSWVTVSHDYGVSWNPYTFNGDIRWRDVASSSDGSKVVIFSYFFDTGFGGSIALSNISGDDFINGSYSSITPAGDSGNWSDIAMSADGSRIVVGNYRGNIYTYNAGVWTQQVGSGIRYWSGVASSADGSVLVAVVDGGFIYVSNDSGVTWTEESGAGNRSWKGVAISSDGSMVSAVDNGGYVWTGELVTCSESWLVQYSGSCSGQDKFRFYVDVNNCGTTNSLPSDNGSVVLCDVSGGGGGSVSPQVVTVVSPVKSASTTSVFGNFINSIIAWFVGLFS